MLIRSPRPYWSLAAMAAVWTALTAPISPFAASGRAAAQSAPIQTPITGEEDLGDLSEPRQALAQFYRAFNTRDLAMIDANFSTTNVAIDNPVGGIRRGADQPHKMYQTIFRSPADAHVEFWDYTVDRVGDVFWAVGRERGTYRDGAAVKPLNIRTTRIFERENGRWRQVHHHGSIDDAALLAAYQDAVRSPKAAASATGSSTKP